MMETVAPHRIPQWTVADRLRKARELAGLQQIELADLIGINRNSVGNYESGRTHPRRIVLNAWAATTGVPVEWLRHGPDLHDLTEPGQVRHQGLEPRTRWLSASGDQRVRDRRRRGDRRRRSPIVPRQISSVAA